MSTTSARSALVCGAVPLFAVAAALLLAGSASALRSPPRNEQRAAHNSLRGYYTIEGSLIMVTITNDGTETIDDIDGTVPGKKRATSATTPVAPCQVQASQFACELNLRPRETTTIRVDVSPAVTPADGPVTIYAATEKRTDRQPYVIPLRTASEPGPPKSCKCAALRVGGRGPVRIANPDRQGRVNLRLMLRWVMTCSAGSEKTCIGGFRIEFPSGPEVTFVSPKGAAVGCRGTCRPNGRISVPGEAKLHVTGGKELYPAVRAGKTIAIRLNGFCVQSGKSRRVSTAKIVIVFNGQGVVDATKSDLNANGIPDGKEPKPA